MSTPIQKYAPSQNEFLEAAYEKLNYREGALLDSIDTSQVRTVDVNEWLEKGNWLELGKKINAEKIFFVRNDPVIVFRAFDAPPDDSEILTMFRMTWCMTRSQYLFLAFPGELRVYGLRQSPPQSNKDPDHQLMFERINKIADVSVKLQAYRREQLEAGYFPQDRHFGKADEQADKQLINDLKQVRKQLREIDSIKLEYVHALIGRSIFVRYLEDRRILHPSYFEKVAINHKRADWLELLNQPPPSRLIQDKKWEQRRYYQVLQDKDFTYALFKQLAQDFNGDLFPRDEAEENAVTSTHLEKLRKFLLGDSDTKQSPLWLWAYDFEIIPIELISSIYEEFYKNEQDDPGTHYTPSILVEFVLSQVLPQHYLEANPLLKILDPACGSGIFLVEAYRRLVRYRILKAGRPLNSIELREILRDQIRGIEINKNAAQISSFSLYLALLHYQEPSDILAQIEFPQTDDKPLPNLIYNVDQINLPNQYGIILNTNAFSLTKKERTQLETYLQAHTRRSTLRKYLESVNNLPIESNSIDIIVGNPPWGRLRQKSQEIQWCNNFDWSIGDNESSQAFIARALNLLKPGGFCGFLVKVTVFLTHYDASQKFRHRWLKETTLKMVFNFTHVRQNFFETAIAPFSFVIYQNKVSEPNHKVSYISAKKTNIIQDKPNVVLHISDYKQIHQRELNHNYQLWKIYWWGNQSDAALISLLSLEKPLEEFVDKNKDGKPLIGRGFEGDFATGDHKPSNWLKDFKELPTSAFQKYGQIDDIAFTTVPDFVHRRREKWVYEDWRLLIKSGITQANNINGDIETRLECKPYCYRDAIYVVRLKQLKDWQRKIILGIFWSNLTRYYFFETASAWGTWNYKLRLTEIKQLPIRFPDNIELRNQIINIVDKLTDWDFSLYLLNKTHEIQAINNLEHQLDNAIFDLYELNESERDLVLDMCETGLEFFYRHSNSNATKFLDPYPIEKQGLFTDLPRQRDSEKGLQGYLYAFLDMWQSYLEPEGVFRWRVVRPHNDPMLAVVFSTQSKYDDFPTLQDDEAMWADLKRIAESSRWELNARIYIDGLVRLVTDNEIIIIKRNERRLWTRSQAREDAEATFLQAMHLQENRLESE